MGNTNPERKPQQPKIDKRRTQQLKPETLQSLPSCNHCAQKIESGMRHEHLPNNRCRVWSITENVPLYTSEKPRTSGWGKE